MSYNNHSLTHGNQNNFEFHQANGRTSKMMLGSLAKPAPSKWDDAQKWLAGLSGGGGDHIGRGKSKRRNSNAADERMLLNSASQRGRESADLGLFGDIALGSGAAKDMDCSESLQRMSKPAEEVMSVCLRDVGTEMTPIASQEPSRTATPVRSTTPALTSPIDSRASSPGMGVKQYERKNEAVASNAAVQTMVASSLEARALAWDEAERAKYMARYKREEVKIQAWENREKRKAETEMKRIEVKAERMRSRAQEKLANKAAATRRVAEERRTNAEAKLSEQAARTAERADYVRRTGRLPFSFNMFVKLPSLCG